MDPITILAGLKTGLAAGKSVASLSKQIGQFFDATDSAKKKLQQKGVSGKNVNAIAMERFAKLRQAAEAEEELKKYISETLGPSHWQTLLKIRREVLQEKREAEAQARRDQIAQQELMITVAGILVLLIFTFVGAAAYLHYMNWIDVRDYFP
jgi:dihydroorotase|tara:strand:- start:51 stop:506 length:456 start_codon:yes stop_codon:yes gene_type:complete